jgi:methionyl-tRNA formyltransferase
MKVVFFGTPQFAVPTLKALIAHPEIQVVAVVTQPDKRRGRGNTLSPSPVKQVALVHQLPVWQPQRVKRDRDTLDHLRQTQADCFVVVAYGQILSQEILEMPRLGCVNGHGSLLPQYRGAAPIQWCLYHGDGETGITTMLMDVGMDTGAMLLKATVPIALLDNAQQLADRLAHLCADLMPETLFKLAAEQITPIPQDDTQATYAPLLQKADYALDWSRSALALHNEVRGFYPHCVTTVRNQPLKVTATVPLLALVADQLPAPEAALLAMLPEEDRNAAGTIAAIFKQIGAVIQTGEGYLLLQEVQLAGKRSQSGWDFANGMRLQVGEVLQPTP